MGDRKAQNRALVCGVSMRGSRMWNKSMEFKSEAADGGTKSIWISRDSRLGIPPENDHPDMMVSCFLPDSEVRFPLWAIDLQYGYGASQVWGQAHSYGLQALRHNRSVLPPDYQASVRTSALSYKNELRLDRANWEISDGFRAQHHRFVSSQRKNLRRIRCICSHMVHRTGESTRWIIQDCHSVPFYWGSMVFIS